MDRGGEPCSCRGMAMGVFDSRLELRDARNGAPSSRCGYLAAPTSHGLLWHLQMQGEVLYI